jgi:hypothetical protein
VFDALTTIEGLRGWWSCTASGSAAKGDIIKYGFCAMQVIAAEPSKLVHWRCIGGPDEWLNTEVIFRLDWKEDQTFVVFKHANWKEPVEFMHHCSTKWATFLLRPAGLAGEVERTPNSARPQDCRQWLTFRLWHKRNPTQR